jgi:hypothetical protein
VGNAIADAGMEKSFNDAQSAASLIVGSWARPMVAANTAAAAMRITPGLRIRIKPRLDSREARRCVGRARDAGARRAVLSRRPERRDQGESHRGHRDDVYS